MMQWHGMVTYVHRSMSAGVLRCPPVKSFNLVPEGGVRGMSMSDTLALAFYGVNC